VGYVQPLVHLINTEGKLMAVSDLIKQDQFLEIFRLLDDSLVEANVVRNTLDSLELGVIACLYLGLLRDELHDLELFHFLRGVWVDDLDVVSRIDEVVLLDTLFFLVLSSLGQIDL
jgi:hypothetical protein